MEHDNSQQHSKRMGTIRSTNTKDEVRLAKALWHLGFRYRKNNKKVFGKPDLTFQKLKVAIFVDSEFFHGKDWEIQKHRFKTNQEFWHKKIERNMRRDIEVNDYLIAQNWVVLRYWCKDLQNDLTSCITEIKKAIFLRQNLGQ